MDSLRRDILKGGFALTSGALLTPASALGASDWAPSLRYPDPAIKVLDKRFEKYRIPVNTNVERLYTGCRWSEGPVWFGDQRLLIWADIPNDRMLKYDERSGEVSIFRSPSNYANGSTRDRQGRLVTCEHLTRRVARTEYDGSITVLCDRYQGKRLNSPNDVVVHSDRSIWFTDPPFGLFNGMDKDPAKQLPFNGVFRYAGGKLRAVITDMTLPNGIGFSPDGKTLYVSNYGPDMYVRAYSVGPGGTLSKPRTLIRYATGSGPGGPDGLKIDTAGNLWTSGPGGIRIVTPGGKVLGQIKLPEVAANLAFAGDGHTVYITGSTSIYRLRSKVAGELPLYRR